MRPLYFLFKFRIAYNTYHIIWCNCSFDMLINLYFLFCHAQEGATELWGAKAAQAISTFTWWIIPNSTCRSSPAQWGWIHNWELRTILLSTSHCMKTKQLSVVCHRQQPNQAQLPLNSVKLRSLCLSGLSVTYLTKWSKAIYCQYARKRPGHALFTFRSKQWQTY